MRVRFSDAAATSLESVLFRIGNADPFALRRFRRRIFASVARIARFPHSGNFVREYPAMPLREFIVEPYRFAYFVDSPRKLVRIVAVWHGAQLPTQPDLSAP
jgi:plasmid stabilization system protein ParE